jgi:type IV pilus assembly protein PilB
VVNDERPQVPSGKYPAGRAGSLVIPPEMNSPEADAVEARLRDVVDKLREADEAAAKLAEARARISELEAITTTESPPVDHSPDASVTGDVESVQDAAIERDEAWVRGSGRQQGFSRLGELIVSRGLVTAEELDRALELQRSTGRRLGETLVEMGVISRVDLAKVLADHLGVPFADLDATPPDVMAASLISGDVARRYQVVPLQRWDDQLVVGMADPNDVFALDDLRLMVRHPIIAALCEPEQLSAAIERLYHRSSIESTLGDAADDELTSEQALEEIAGVDDGPMVRLVNALLEQAVADRASDLHIEPASEYVSIRLRVDGILHDISVAPTSVLRPMVSRLKVLAGLDISQSRVPQDGRFSLAIHGRAVDVRVATIPTAAGESVTLRLLDSVRGITTLSALGLTSSEADRLAASYRAAQGAIFVTGPTGSGKTSTLYAVLTELNNRDKSIVSVEDPVEYRIDGIKQVQINTRAGMTFPGALRSILRADPDAILIGEVRDAETARIAADASITGHLVLSTLHATRAAAAPIRLIDMGVEPYLVASALTCIVAQRLVRKVCPHCATNVDQPDLELLRHFGADEAMLDTTPTIREANGCPRCIGTGYVGRAAVFEIMPITEELSRLIVERASTAEIERVAIEQGMDTLRRAALKRVVQGELTIEEMMRVVS